MYDANVGMFNSLTISPVMALQYNTRVRARHKARLRKRVEWLRG